MDDNDDDDDDDDRSRTCVQKIRRAHCVMHVRVVFAVLVGVAIIILLF
jgi:hypothetical protein